MLIKLTVLRIKLPKVGLIATGLAIISATKIIALGSQPSGQFLTALHSLDFMKNSVCRLSRNTSIINTDTDTHHFFVYINNVQWQPLYKEASNPLPLHMILYLK